MKDRDWFINHYLKAAKRLSNLHNNQRIGCLQHQGWNILVLSETEAQWTFRCTPADSDSDDILWDEQFYTSRDGCIQAAKRFVEKIRGVADLGLLFDSLLESDRINSEEYAKALTLLGLLGR